MADTLSFIAKVDMVDFYSAPRGTVSVPFFFLSVPTADRNNVF